MAFDPDALGEFLKGVRGRDPLHLGPVGTGVPFFRVKQSAVQAGFIAEQKHAFGVGIQPAQGINVFRKPKFSEGSVGRSVRGKSAEHPVGLVKGKQHPFFLSAQAAFVPPEG